MLIALLKIHEALLKVGERGKIVRSEYLSLNDGEIDFDLVDPAGVNGSVHKKSVGPAGSNAFNCFLTTVSRTVIHDPRNTLSGFVGLAPHNLGDEPIGGSNASFLFTMSEELGMMDVPSRQIAPSALPEILMLDPRGSAGGSRGDWAAYGVVLENWLFICGDSKLRAMQGFPLPDSGVEIENAFRLRERSRDPEERSNFDVAKDERRRHPAQAKVRCR